MNPDFATTVECDYFFEREQHIRFTVNDVDGSSNEIIGQLETTIAKIIGAPKQTFLADLNKPGHKQSRGKIVIRTDNVNSCNDELRIKFRARLQPHATFCCEDENNPYFVISHARDPMNPTESFGCTRVTAGRTQPTQTSRRPSLPSRGSAMGTETCPSRFRSSQLMPVAMTPSMARWTPPSIKWP